MPKRNSKQSRVPASRLGRLTRLGFAAGELALGGLAQGVRNVARNRDSNGPELFLSAGGARKLAQRLAGMRGAAMKLGQVLSMESADLLPRQFADALAILRDSADTMPHSQLRRVLGREYGKGWEAQFEHFEFEPLAAASIGQVHRVTTRDGRDLALKIQYPGVARSIDSDVDNLSALLRMSRLLPAGLDISGFMDEAKRQLKREADYTLEADYLAMYSSLLGDSDEYCVPGVHKDLSTRRILAMDYVPGVPLESLAEIGISQSERDEIGRRLQQLVFRELFEFRTMQSDPNFANYLYQPEQGRIVLLDFGSTVTFEEGFTDNYAGIARSLIDSDEGAVRHYATRLGYLAPDTDERYAARALEIIRMVCEPIYSRFPYDFGQSKLFARARDVGMEMFLEGERDYVIPPTQAAFLHRKLVGSFLMCARLGSRVNVHELIRPHLPSRAWAGPR